MFFDMYKFVYSKSVFNTLYIEIKKTNVKKFPSDKINGTKNVQPHHSSTFNLRLLHELKHNVRLSKSVCGIFHCQFCLVLIKFIFLFSEMHGLLTFKRLNSFQN